MQLLYNDWIGFYIYEIYNTIHNTAPIPKITNLGVSKWSFPNLEIMDTEPPNQGL